MRLFEVAPTVSWRKGQLNLAHGTKNEK